MLQNLPAAATLHVWIDIYRRDIFFSCVELRSSLDIDLRSAIPVSSTTLCKFVSLGPKVLEYHLAVRFCSLGESS